MRKRRVWRWVQVMLLAMLVGFGGAGTVLATTSNSNSYQATEMQFGSGSTLESCSGQYCAQASIGDMTSGAASSGDSTAQFGGVTPGDPLLEVIVDPGDSNLGVLTTERTATKTTMVRVRNYLSSGYILQIIGDPPKYAGHTLSTPSSPTASSKGTEQFAINAVANTDPSVGANPIQVPSGDFSFGVVQDEYKIANQFKYVSGDAIARSDSQTGQTDYTISMIVNVSNATPAGHYTGEFSAVVIPVY